MEILYTDQLFSSRSILVYGDTGSGKTRLIQTCIEQGWSCFVVNTDDSLVSIKKVRCPYINVYSIAAMVEFMNAFKSGQFNQYNLVALDDASELSKIVLRELKPQFKNKQQAYGEHNDMVRAWLTEMRNHTAFPGYQLINAKLTKVVDGTTGGLHFGPKFEGRELGNDVKYMYDEKYYLASGETEDGGFWNAFRTRRDEQYVAGSRGDCLDLWEPANLPHVINKIANG